MSEEEKWEPSFMRLSPSKINTYMKCPREFYYKYIAKIPEKKTIQLRMAEVCFFSQLSQLLWFVF